MCHDVDENWIPEGNIRYKVASRKNGGYCSAFNNYFAVRNIWQFGNYEYKPGRNIAFPKNKDVKKGHEGFHFFLTLEEAKEFMVSESGSVILECTVSDFIAGGLISEMTMGEGMRCETWRVIEDFKFITDYDTVIKER